MIMWLIAGQEELVVPVHWGKGCIIPGQSWEIQCHSFFFILPPPFFVPPEKQQLYLTHFYLFYPPFRCLWLYEEVGSDQLDLIE